MLLRWLVALRWVGDVVGRTLALWAIGVLIVAGGVKLIGAVGWLSAALFLIGAVLLLAALLATAQRAGWLGGTGWRADCSWVRGADGLHLGLRHYDGAKIDGLGCQVRGPRFWSQRRECTGPKWAPDHVSPPDPHYYALFPRDFDGGATERGVYQVTWTAGGRTLARTRFSIPPW